MSTSRYKITEKYQYMNMYFHFAEVHQKTGKKEFKPQYELEIEIADTPKLIGSGPVEFRNTMQDFIALSKFLSFRAPEGL